MDYTGSRKYSWRRCIDRTFFSYFAATRSSQHLNAAEREGEQVHTGRLTGELDRAGDGLHQFRWYRSRLFLGAGILFLLGRIPFLLELLGDTTDTPDQVIANHAVEFLIYRQQCPLPSSTLPLR